MPMPVTHIARVDRRRNFTSPTLPAAALQGLEGAFRTVPMWRDRWSHYRSRTAARRVLRACGSLVILGPGLKFDVPPPFAEFFEPIEISRGLGDDTERLKVLSGEGPTREERITRGLKWLGLVVGAGLLGWLGVSFAMGSLPLRPLVLTGGMGAFTVGVVGLVMMLRRLGGQWFLVPGGIAVIRRPPRRGLPPRITVLSRVDTCLVFRLVHTGKTVVLIAELWTHAGRVFRRSVSQREAMSILAAWQSPHAPPPDDKLVELVNWEAR